MGTHSKLPSKTRHFSKHWVLLRDPAPVNKVENRSTVGFHMPVPPPQKHTYMHAHENGKRKIRTNGILKLFCFANISLG